MAARKSSAGTALKKYDAKLAEIAAKYADTEANTGGGQFFSLRGGVLKFQDNALPNNEVAAIILDYRLENVFYEGGFDPDAPQAPTCYAFGEDEATMEPFSAVEDKQSDDCASCPHNKFGSAEKGRGKACRNARRLALIPAGTINRSGAFELSDADDLAKVPLAFLKVPPTSITAFASYVKQLSGALRRPPFAVVTKLRLVPDPKTQFKLAFEVLEELDEDYLDVVIKRHEDASANIEFAYAKVEDEPAQQPKSRGRGAPARGSAKRKY